MARSEDGTRRRLWMAVVAGLSHWLLTITVQVGDFLAYLLPAGTPMGSSLGYLLTIPFLQSQAIGVSALLGATAFGLGRWKAARWLILTLTVALNVVTLADQVMYKILLDHVRPSLFERGSHVNVTVAFSSLTREIDAVFWYGVTVALPGLAGLVYVMLRPPAGRPNLRWAVAPAAIIFVAGLPASRATQYYHLNEHPLVVAALDWRVGSLAPSLGHRSAPHSAGPATMETESRFADLPRRRKLPNVVLIVLESVGAVNLLTEGGLPSPIYTPNLAKLAQRGVLFNSVYSSFPGTTRSLVSLHTGGRQATQGDIGEYEQRYEGPMLSRSMKALGYETALFSSERLDVESCDVFLRQGDYDKFQDFGRDFAGRSPENSIHSWGAREEYTIGLIDNWLDEQKGPFYLEYMNVATHHPYGTPPGYRVPTPGADPQSQYRNALHYSDRAVGTLLASLERRGLLESTLIVVTGDHGEGFGDLHRGNLLHKNFLYEENIRGFVQISDPAWRLDRPVVSDRLAGNGDIMPTLLAYIGAPEPSLPSQDLLRNSIPARRIFFFKNALPEKWGLREGQWKYIGEIRSGAAELYDLSVDPAEQRNIAGEHPEMVARFASLCEEWFIRSEAEYTSRLPNFRPPGGHIVLPAEYRTPGAKVQSVGLMERGGFVERSTLQGGTRPFVWNLWVAGGTAHRARWCWTSPSGKELWSDMELAGDWTLSYVPLPGAKPPEPGNWSVRIHDGGKPGLISKFTVVSRKTD
jgi:arylsulfatase A-like enzyme